MATINGTNGNDLIDESSATDKVKIKGKDGDDTLKGGSEKDDIDGDDGDDSIVGNGGDDKLDGGDGDDTIDGGDGEDDIKGGKGKDTVLGGRNDDKIDGDDGNDYLDGGEGDDDIKGGKGDDTILGGDGEDKIKGDDGDDLIYAGAGDDDVKGGKGDDTVQGGLGDDKMDGGSGIDTAVYSGGIADYSFAGTGSGGISGGGKLFVTDLYAGDGDDGTDELKKFEFLYFEADDYTLDLTGGNNAPLARDDSAATDEDSAVNISGAALLTNDFDPDPGDVLTISGVDAAGASGGLITDNGNGTFTYDPNGAFEALAAGETGTDTFTYTVTDGNGATDTATVTVSITGVNDAPVASDDTGSGNEDTDITGNVLDNDIDVDSTVLTAALLSGPANGAVVLNPDGSYTYTPDPDYNGTDSFTYTLSDGDLTDTATVTLTVDPVNDAPTVDATDPTGFTEDLDASAQNLFQTGTVNFDDIDAGDLIDITSSINGQPVWSGGVLNGAQITALAGGLSADVTDAAVPGSTPYTYDATLDLDFLGQGETITIDYTIVATDVFGQNGTDVISFVITGENDAPIANDDGGAAFTTDEDSSFFTGSVLQNDTDPDANDNIALFALDDTATIGNVSFLGGGSFNYDPSGQFEYLALGDTATDTFTYTISDGKGGTDTATATITIEGANDRPGADVLTFDTTEDQEAAFINLNALVGDVDNGDVLTISDVSVISGAPVVIDEEGGIVRFDTTGFNALGVGESDSFVIQYTVTDDSGAANDSSVETVTVNINGLNDAPLAGNSTATADETTGTPLVIDLGPPLTSDPDANDTLSYELDAIIGADDKTGTVAYGEDVTLTNLTVLDFTVDGTTYTPGDTATLTEGTLTIEADGSYVFNPVLNYVGPVPTVSYNATGAEDVSLQTRDANPRNGFVNIPEGFALDDFTLNNVTYAAGATATFLGGEITINSDGSYTLTPTFGIPISTPVITLNTAGTDTLPLEADGALREFLVPSTLVGSVLTINAAEFGLDAGEERDFIVRYAVTDDSGAENDTSFGDIVVTVTGGAGDAPGPDNTQPVAGNAVYEGDDETEVSINLLALTSDADAGDVLSIAPGTVEINADGREEAIVFAVSEAGVLTLDPSQFGLEDGEELFLSGSYAVMDDSGEINDTATGGINISIVGVAAPNPNNAPVAQSPIEDISEGGLVTYDLLDLVSDLDGDTLTISGVTFGDPEGGEIEAEFTINNTGTEYEIIFDPAQFGAADGEIVTVTLGYEVDDGTGQPNSSANGFVTFNITGTTENAAPVAQNQTFDYAVPVTPGLSLDLDDFVSDPDGDTVTVTSISLDLGNVPVGTQPSLLGSNFVAGIDFTQFALGEDDTAEVVLNYAISDGNGGADTGALTFNLTGNSAPTAGPLAVFYNLDTQTGDITFDLNLQVGDDDPGDVGNLTITVDDFIAGGEEGETPVGFVNDDGEITFDPTQFGLADGEELVAQLIYTVDDGAGQFNSLTSNVVEVTISNPLDNPAVTLDFEEFNIAGDLKTGVSGSKGFVFGGGAEVFETDELPEVGGNGRPGSGMVIEQGLVQGQTTDPGDNVLVVGPGDENQPFSINGAGAPVPTPFEAQATAAAFGAAFNMESISLNGAYNDDMEVTITPYRVVESFGSFSLVAVDSFVFNNIDASTLAEHIDFTSFIGDGTEYNDPLTAAAETSAFENIVKVEFIVTDPGVSAGLGGPGDEIVLDDAVLILV